jgi:hypothetical protein
MQLHCSPSTALAFVCAPVRYDDPSIYPPICRKSVAALDRLCVRLRWSLWLQLRHQCRRCIAIIFGPAYACILSVNLQFGRTYRTYVGVVEAVDRLRVVDGHVLLLTKLLPKSLRLIPSVRVKFVKEIGVAL